jgi:hypothetical protein
MRLKLEMGLGDDLGTRRALAWLIDAGAEGTVTMSAADLVRLVDRRVFAIEPAAESALVTLRLEDWMAIAKEARR